LQKSNEWRIAMQRLTFLKSLGFIPFIGYLAPIHIRVIVPYDLTMDQLLRALSDIYRNIDSDQATPEFVLTDGRILSGKQSLFQTVYEYDLGFGDISHPRIYRELYRNGSSISLFRYNWFLLNCGMATNTPGSFIHIAGLVRDIVDKLPSDECARFLEDRIGDQGESLRRDLREFSRA